MSAITSCSSCGVELAGAATFCPSCGGSPRSPQEPSDDSALDRDPLLESVPRTPAGRVLGGARLLRNLGGGSLGAVYAARLVAGDDPVAIKLLPRALIARSKADIERFLADATEASRVRHPSLVRTRSVGHERGLFYVLMDRIEGTSAQALVARRGPLPENEALRIARDVALGLAEAHRAGLVHRDVKPDNVLVRADGSAVLSDLGLARAIHGTRDGTSKQGTAAGATLATIAFMAPEVPRDASKASPASDVYSLGATLATLLTGRWPHEAPTLPTLVDKVVASPPLDVAAARPELRPATRDLVARCLARDPATRPKDGAELGRLLEALLGAAVDDPTGVHPALKTPPAAADETSAPTVILPGPATPRAVEGPATRAAETDVTGVLVGVGPVTPGARAPATPRSPETDVTGVLGGAAPVTPGAAGARPTDATRADPARPDASRTPAAPDEPASTKGGAPPVVGHPRQPDKAAPRTVRPDRKAPTPPPSTGGSRVAVVGAAVVALAVVAGVAWAFLRPKPVPPRIAEGPPSGENAPTPPVTPPPVTPPPVTPPPVIPPEGAGPEVVPLSPPKPGPDQPPITPEPAPPPVTPPAVTPEPTPPPVTPPPVAPEPTPPPVAPEPTPPPVAPEPAPPRPGTGEPPPAPLPAPPTQPPEPKPPGAPPATPPRPVPVAELPPDQRVFDGHKWRLTPSGHKHGSRCGHFPGKAGWRTDAAEPRVYPYDVEDAKRRKAESGLYDFGGRTWWIRDHVHGPGCFHKLRDDLGYWVLED